MATVNCFEVLVKHDSSENMRNASLSADNQIWAATIDLKVGSDKLDQYLWNLIDT